MIALPLTANHPAPRRSLLIRVLLLLVFWLVVGLPACASASVAEGHAAEDAAALGETLPLWSALPFAAILLAIALGPLIAPHHWHRHYTKVTIAIALSFAVPFLIAYRGPAIHEILHMYLIDYFPFIILLWGLFTVAGGIVLRGTIAGTPAVNVGFLAVGTAIASWMGTTGASMLLIRPVLRANAVRRRQAHVIVFFIFLVSNIGGSLTPLGDPPLFLGFLHGLPFFWTFRLLPITLFVAGSVLAIFYLIDRRYYRQEKREAAARKEEKAEPARTALQPLRFAGAYNFIFLAIIVGAVLLSGLWRPGSFTLLGVHLQIQNLVRDALIILAGLISLAATPAALRADNNFSWAPIREVAILFAGIFMTIIPALAILKAGEQGHLAALIRAVDDPAHYFWATGLLSSFLDNAPTYLSFLNSLVGRYQPGLPEAIAVHTLGIEQSLHLEAVATGAVFMGANTYIGNAPNFMVKSIAEGAGVAMPSFFGYLARWSVIVLFPIFVLTTWLFF